jgi:hypothetical protein
MPAIRRKTISRFWRRRTFTRSHRLRGAQVIPGSPCVIGTTCTSPSGFDLIVETDIDPQNNNGVERVRYQLPAGTTTLLRGVASKALGMDPIAVTSATGMLPYVQNVMNNARPLRLRLCEPPIRPCFRAASRFLFFRTPATPAALTLTSNTTPNLDLAPWVGRR